MSETVCSFRLHMNDGTYSAYRCFWASVQMALSFPLWAYACMCVWTREIRQRNGIRWRTPRMTMVSSANGRDQPWEETAVETKNLYDLVFIKTSFSIYNFRPIAHLYSIRLYLSTNIPITNVLYCGNVLYYSPKAWRQTHTHTHTMIIERSSSIIPHSVLLLSSFQ